MTKSEESSSKKLFTKEMRDVSKSIHNTSDALVNLKLGMSASEPKVWAEGLLIFYEIFKYLDQFLDDHRDSLIGELIVDPAMFRTKAFEKDLSYYYSRDFTEDSPTPRIEVETYLKHLEELKEKDPYLVTAYVYHLYMGLFSGGQILSAKRYVTSGGSKADEGNAVTDFGDIAISTLKRKMRDAMNRIADELDQSTKDAICAEGIKVFELNNSIIKTVQGVDEIFYRKLSKILAIVLLIVVFIVYLFKIFL